MRKPKSYIIPVELECFEEEKNQNDGRTGFSKDASIHKIQALDEFFIYIKGEKKIIGYQVILEDYPIFDSNSRKYPVRFRCKNFAVPLEDSYDVSSRPQSWLTGLQGASTNFHREFTKDESNEIKDYFDSLESLEIF